MSIPRPLPRTDDLDTGGFFRAAEQERLAFCVCSQCGSTLHMPRAFCHTCRSWNAHWREVAPFGRIYSWTVVVHQVHPAFPVPHTIVLIEIEDRPDVRLVGHLPGAPALAVGQRVEAWFETIDGVTFPQWRVAVSGDHGEE